MSTAPITKAPGPAFALLVALAGFMELFDGTVIQTALPSMGRSFGVTAAGASIAMAVYFAAAAGAIPVCAWLSDRFGVKAVFTVSIGTFTMASLLCGLSDQLGWLIAFRILQGLGGAIMMTTGQISILRDAPKVKLLNVTAYLVWPALAAPVIAPAVGGLIADTIGWRWLFFLNLPLGLIGIFAALVLAPGRAHWSANRKLDWVGALLLAIGLCSLIPGLGMVDAGLAPARILAVIVGLVVSAIAIAWLLRQGNPLLDLSIFKVDTFRASNLEGAVYRASGSAVPVVLTLLFQVAYGWNAVSAGLLVMLVFVGNLSIKPFANYSVRRWGNRLVIIGATVLGAACLLAIAFVTKQTSLLLVAPLLYLSGAARSVGFTSYMTMQYQHVPKEQMASASPLSGSVHQLATAIGIATSLGAASVLQASGVGVLEAYRFVFIGMAAVLGLSAVGLPRLEAKA